MRPYLSRSPVTPVADPAGHRTTATLDLGDRARLLLLTHVAGVDGWCAGCLAAGSFYFPPCPVVTGLLLTCGEPGAGSWLTGRSA